MGRNTQLSANLVKVLSKEGFKPNSKKTRLQPRNTRQDVTGIIVNEFSNVRRKYINSIFGMIYSWKRFKYDNATKVYLEKYFTKTRGKISGGLYRSVVIGKISHVANIRGWGDIVVQKLCRKYCECDQSPPKRIGVIGNMATKFDVFIGHASEQKQTVAKPLYEALTAIGIRTFIDLVEIKWGDSLTAIINNALSESQFFLAIISIESISKSWPDNEMNSAIARQIGGQQKILPLFYGTKAQIEKCKSHYPLLADRFYKEWANNPDAIALEIQALLKP